MGFIGELFQGLLKIFCAPPQQERPSYAQQPAVHQVQPQYPPQQQWQPPQQSPTSAEHQQQHQQNRPHPHKPHHGHGQEGTSPPSQPHPPLHHPVSPPVSRPTDGRVTVRHFHLRSCYLRTNDPVSNGPPRIRTFLTNRMSITCLCARARIERATQWRVHSRRAMRLMHAETVPLPRSSRTKGRRTRGRWSA